MIKNNFLILSVCVLMLTACSSENNDNILENNSLISGNDTLQIPFLKTVIVNGTEYINTELTDMDLDMLHDMFKDDQVIVIRYVEEEEQDILSKLCQKFENHTCDGSKSDLLIYSSDLTLEKFKLPKIEFIDKESNTEYKIDIESLDMIQFPVSEEVSSGQDNSTMV